MKRHLDASLSPAERAKALLKIMNVEEKIGQLCKLDGFKSYERDGGSLKINKEFKDKFSEIQIGSMYGLLRSDWWTQRGWINGVVPKLMGEAVNMFQKYVTENTRFKIPLLLAEEAPHGLMALGCTVFPTGLGMGSTWNPELIRRIGETIGAEGASSGVHTVYGPILDVPQDPRWSRTEEDFSEDPALTAELGKAYVEGVQGGGLPRKGSLFSTLKHFGAHGTPEGGHNSLAAHLGPIELRNFHLKPFETCVKAGAGSLMCAYNTVDGIPCGSNKALLTGILRDEWGFDGFVVSDRGVIPNHTWQRLAADEAEAAAKVLKAGLDTDEGCIDFYAKGLRDALKRGLIDIEDLDRAVERVLTMKFRLGLFEDPYFKAGGSVDLVGSPKHKETALEAARQSLVLISNKADALPLENVKRLAVIGPNANAPMNQLGDYTAPQLRDAISTPLDGIKELGSKRGVEVLYSKGCKIRSLNSDLLNDALETAKKADAVVLVIGGSSASDSEASFQTTGAAASKQVAEASESDKESGEGYDRAKLRLAGLQLELLRSLRKLGKRIVSVLVMGRPLIIDEVVELSDAVLMAWYPGMQGGRAIAEALFGEFNPGGKLPISIPCDEAQLPVYYYSYYERPNYIDLKSKPSFQFGFGLSYTGFEISKPELDKASMSPSGKAVVSVNVKNVGKRDGDEVVQLYITARSSSVARPMRELKAFKRVHVKAGEAVKVSFSLGSSELGVYGQDLKWRVEPGKYTVAAGGSLASLLESELEVKPKGKSVKRLERKTRR